MATAAIAVQNALNSAVRSGGSPTNSALQTVSTMVNLVQTNRQTFVFLVTDGAPNCNASNPENACNGGATCECTLGPAALCSAAFCSKGCLDRTVNVVASSLFVKGVRTMVFAVGNEFQMGTGLQAITNIGLNGKLPRTCATGNCGLNGRCADAGICSLGVNTLDTANDRQETVGAATRLVNESFKCRYSLVRNPGANLQVTLSGMPVPKVVLGGNRWAMESDNLHLVFGGDFCNQLINTTGLDPLVKD